MIIYMSTLYISKNWPAKKLGNNQTLLGGIDHIKIKKMSEAKSRHQKHLFITNISIVFITWDLETLKNLLKIDETTFRTIKFSF